MKKLLLSALFLAWGVALLSQSLTLSYNEEPVAPGGTVQLICDPGVQVATAYISCTNNGSVSLSVRTKKIIYPGDTLTGTSNYFCWGACFPPYVYVSPNGILIDPGVTNTDFYADYEPRTIPGISRITYVFFDENNINDSVALTMEWNASPAGIAEDLLSKVRLSEAYPNPASTVASIDYELPSGMENSVILVSNLLGVKVMELPLSQMAGRLEIPVYDLQTGIYFYTLKSQNNLALTKKFVVRH